MGRGLHLAVALVVAATATARAGSSHKVMVETDPEGAHVYIDDVDKGSVCEKTPCSFDVPAGTYSIIVQLQNYAPTVEPLEVPKNPKKPLIKHYKLQPAIGTLVFDSSPAAKGATITIDDADKGKLGGGSTRLEIDPGGHHVVVALGGKTLYEEIINVETGEEVPIKVNAAAAPTSVATTDTVKVDDDTSNTTTTTPGGSTSISTTAPETTRSHFISADLVVDVGFRRFSYTNAMTGPLAPESEDGQVIAGPAVEIWPTELLGIDHLRGMSLFMKLELPVNHQDVLDSMKQPLGPTTYWMTFEASVKQRWAGDMAALEVSGGYVMDQLRFNGDAGDLMKLPDANYQSIRIGARGALLLGAIEPYVSIESRFVQDGGVLATRFQTASASGYKGAVGIAARGGNFVGRVEASDLHYDWSLSQASQPGFYGADSATDKVLGFSFLLGYQY